jgi:hypothetical protein
MRFGYSRFDRVMSAFNVCPACNKTCKDERGVNIHLSTSKKCAWFRYGLGEQLPGSTIDDYSSTSDDPGNCDSHSRSFNDEDDYDDDDAAFQQLENFVAALELATQPRTQASTSHIGSRSPVEDPQIPDVEEEALILDSFPKAGAVVGREDHVYTDWVRRFNPRNLDHVLDKDFYAPFISYDDWQVARWTITEPNGPSQSAMDRLLRIGRDAKNLMSRTCMFVPICPFIDTSLQLANKIGVSWKNSRELHQVIDTIPDRAPWSETNIFLRGSDVSHRIFFRNPIDCVRALWQNPAYADQMHYCPQRIYKNKTRSCRVYNELWSGDWWWDKQELLPVGMTIAPIILSSDKTKLTNLTGAKVAYPLYLTIGNIPKKTRRRPSTHACILLAYLSADSISDPRLSKAAQSALVQRLFHTALRLILAPLRDVNHQQGLRMVSGDGAIRCVVPIVACYAADYPEQRLVTTARSMTCPICDISSDQLGEPGVGETRTQMQTLADINHLFNLRCTQVTFTRECRRLKLNGAVEAPFWEDFESFNIFGAITADVLHQLLSGTFGAHLVEWCSSPKIVKEKNGLDRFLRLFPPACNVRIFKDGFGPLSQITGPEYKDMAQLLLGALVVASVDDDVIYAARALLDFLYIAQYSSHNDSTLGYLDEALNLWHQSKDVFVAKGVRQDFAIPKYHSMEHYVDIIRTFGATDNYSTSLFERLHIDFAKRGWRKSSMKDALIQMVQWLNRLEKVETFESYLDWRVAQITARLDSTTLKSIVGHTIHLAKVAPLPRRLVCDIQIRHGAACFAEDLARFILSHCARSKRRHVKAILKSSLEKERIDVWTLAKFSHGDIQGLDADLATRDAIHAQPQRFDCVLVHDTKEAHTTGVEGTRVGQVRLIFRLPKRFLELDETLPSGPLLYLHWFTPFSKNGPDHEPAGMYKIRRQFRTPVANGVAAGSVVFIQDVRHSVHLIPNFAEARRIDPRWNSRNIMEKFDQFGSFYVNNWVNHYTYQSIY